MSVYKGNIEKETIENTNFRKVVSTSPNSQLVLMSLKPGEDIGEEVHHVDQFFRVEAGTGKAVVSGQEWDIEDGDAIVVPSGEKHNIINTSDSENLKLYTIYSPANHPEGTVHKTKTEAEEAEKLEHH